MCRVLLTVRTVSSWGVNLLSFLANRYWIKDTKADDIFYRTGEFGRLKLRGICEIPRRRLLVVGRRSERKSLLDITAASMGSLRDPCRKFSFVGRSCGEFISVCSYNLFLFVGNPILHITGCYIPYLVFQLFA